MDHAVTYCRHDLSDVEVKHCDKFLSKDDQYNSKRLDRLKHAFECAQENLKEKNQCELVSGVSRTPMLLRHTQAVNLIRACLPLTYYELQHRGTDFHTHGINFHGRNTPIGATSLIKKIKN